MKSTVLVAIALLVSLTAFQSPVAGKETPASTYAARLATLPPPSAERELTFDGAFVVAGNPVGTVSMAAKAGTAADGKPTWVVTVKLEIGGGAMSYDGTSIYDAHLTPIEGTLTTKQGETVKTMAWKVVAEGVRITQGEEAEVLDHKGPFVSSFTTLFLYCRLIGFAEGAQTADIFDADDKAFVSGTWTTGAVGMWDGVKARLVSGKRADGKTIDAGFDLETGELLSVKLGDPDRGQAFEFRPGKGPEKTGDDVFARPAKSPQEAAVQAALAFATADFDLLERVTHWPSIAKATRAKSADAAEMDDDAIRDLFMGQFRQTLTPQGERAVIAPVLASLVPSLPAESQEDGTTLVAFGPAFRDLALPVQAFDGRWYLVRFPAKPAR